MKKIINKFSIVAILIVSIYSCKVEPIKPNEISNSTNTNTTIQEEAYTEPPCSLDSNYINFISKYSFGIASVNPPFQSVNCANASYFVTASMYLNKYDSNPQTFNIYFLSKPQTGKYTVVSSNNLDPQSTTKIAFLTVDYKAGFETKNYQAKEGTIIYVKNSGNSIKISFCETSFTNTFYNSTIQNCKGQIVLNN